MCGQRCCTAPLCLRVNKSGCATDCGRRNTSMPGYDKKCRGISVRFAMKRSNQARRDFLSKAGMCFRRCWVWAVFCEDWDSEARRDGAVCGNN